MKLSEEIRAFDELVELWDSEGQPPDIDWLEYAQDFRNQVVLLEAKLAAIDCGSCEKTLLECKCDDLEDG